MRLDRLRKHNYQAFFVFFVLLIANPSFGGLRGPGKYSGVVVFDRWDTCFLLSGPYITYISNAVKEDLRPYAGTAIQIDAIDVIQPMNPGDALVRKYKVIGPAPEPKYESLEGLELNVTPDFVNEQPAFLVEVRNTGTSATWVRTDEIGITLLSDTKTLFLFCASDGRSGAVITRSNLQARGGHEWSVDDKNEHAYFTLEPHVPLTTRIRINAGQSFSVRLKFDVSPGEYEFLVGYAEDVHASKSLASKRVSFAVNGSGKAIIE